MNIVLGVGGGIAAYKSAELARALGRRGFNVQTVMTASAQEFIQPLTFAALTGRKVITGLFSGGRSADEILSSSVEHISVAQDNEMLVVAPATADLVAKFAHGIADDFLTTLYLAFAGKVVLAPAMNTNMWNHAATQANIATLRGRGHVIIEPEEGLLACGVTGPGRLAEPEHIAEAVESASRVNHDMDGETIVVTAGPTQEPIDPVRYITNRSSGRMGYAVAEAAIARGAKVTLVSGPVKISPPAGASVIHVRTAAEMREAVLAAIGPATVVIKSAAVADYRVSNPSEQKIKKTAARLSLELDPNPDILAELGRIKGDRILVGFAAETTNLLSEARRKLEAKNCDMLVGNDVSQAGIGFDSSENEVTLFLRGGEAIPLPRASKREIADKILDQILKLRVTALEH